jgi:hypothetical protein
MSKCAGVSTSGTLPAAVAASRIEVPTAADLNLPVPGAIPRHCGHNWDDPAFRESHHRAQLLRGEAVGAKYALVSTGVLGPAARAPGAAGGELPAVSSGAAARLHGAIQTRVGASTTGAPTSARSLAGAAADAASLPLSTNRYDLAGRKLSFQAWFTERVPESAIEKVRTRYVGVNFFLEDETVAVYEPIIPCSGLAGGYLLRRARVPLTEADASRRAPAPSDTSRYRDLASVAERHVTVLDFNVGRPLTLFGVEYYLHACDEFTRAMLGALGVVVPPNSDAPPDAGFLVHRQKMIGAGAGTTLPNSARLDPMRAPRAVQRSIQAIEKGGLVARFYCSWGEEHAEAPGAARERRFELHYFLEDDTVSLRERESAATGGEMLARHFLKRVRLPKGGSALPTSAGVVAQAVPGSAPGECYGPRDLFIGARLPIFGRTLTLLDCDDATRRYYSERLGIDLGPAIVPSAAVPLAQPKTFNASTALALLRREPPPAPSTLILKYELALEKPETADDALRRFVLTFYGATGEVAIGELVQRNSGFNGGRVLKPSILPRADGSGPVGVEDLREGNTLRVYGRSFTILRLSPRAEAYAAQMAAEDTGAARKPVAKERLTAVVKAFRDHILGRYVTLAEAFRALDQDGDGLLTEFEVRMFLAKHDLTRDEAEAVAFIDLLNADGVGHVSYADFVRLCADGAAATHSLEAGEVAAVATVVRTRADEQALVVARRVLLDKLRDKLEVRYLNVFEMFRAMSTMPRRWLAAEESDRANAAKAGGGGNSTSGSAGANAAAGHGAASATASAAFAAVGAAQGRRLALPLNALTNAEKDCAVSPVQFRRVLVERLNMNVSDKEMAVLLRCFYPDLPESEYASTEDVDALPPRALRLEDMHRILCESIKA